MVPLLAALGVVPHMYLDRVHARQFLRKWKPQLVAGNVVSTTGVNAYAKVLIALRNPACGGAIARFDAETCMFVVNTDENVTVVTASVSASPTSASDLRAWHESCFPHAVLIDGRLDDPEFLT